MRRILNFAAIALAHLALTWGAIYVMVQNLDFPRGLDPAGRVAEAFVWVLGTPLLTTAALLEVDLLFGSWLEVLSVANSLVWAAAVTLAWKALSGRRLRMRGMVHTF